MGSSITMFITLMATSGVFTTFLCVYAFLKRSEVPGARTFILYTAAQAVYIFAVAFEMASSSLAQIKYWTIIEYLGISTAPALGLVLVMQYLGKNVSHKVIAALFTIPCITMILLTTNDYHHLFYKSMTFREDVPLTRIVIGQWYIVQGSFTFGCMLAAMVLLIRKWEQTKRNYRPQLTTLIVGQFLPMAGAFIYLMGLTPYGIDPVPIVLCVTSAMYIWAMVSTRMLTIVPIAKERIFESMREGAIVLDSAERLIDLNDAVARMIPGLTAGMIGLTLDEAWRQLTGSGFPETVGSLLMLIDVTEPRRLQNQLTQLAFYDGMTKLLNRTAFIHRSKVLLEEARYGQTAIAFVLFDIDYFKRINDTYGHDVGDRAIVHVVSIVRKLIEPDVRFARYGGEEFVLALPAYTLELAGELAEAIRTALEAEPMDIGHGSIVITASFGASEFRDIEDTLESLLRDADTALYRAKRGGRNLVQLHV
ncbi:histidine kinase N-terminal 7TM domain-containing diguanylate cyclase [Paenibacillus aestuarii]|uniref:Histidine kinase N-terminal 7TM domain-containing protein n=1 Tax=Paenibacillus aestuarii TaxID=516965 RepID=A0ABW0K3G1_9BACL|nr:histidine kinase N-terminal 7TM domain-containing protein [Paenibacillus aestuarii]